MSVIVGVFFFYHCLCSLFTFQWVAVTMEKYLLYKKKLPTPEKRKHDNIDNDEMQNGKSKSAKTTHEQPQTSRQEPDPKLPKESQKKKRSKQTKPKCDKNNVSEKERENVFCNKWLEMSEFKDWIAKSHLPNKAFCKLCNENLTAHKAVLTKHLAAQKHISMSKAVSNTPDIEKTIVTTLDKKIAIAELKLSGFIAKEDLPMLIADTLVPLCSKIFPDSKIAAGLKCKRTKTTEVINEVLGPVFDEELGLYLQDHPFSMIFDETTDISSIKQCAATVIYYDDRSDQVEQSFFDIFEGDLRGDCITLSRQILASLERKNIPKTQMIAISTDTTNVMAGEQHSLYTQLRHEIPGLLTIKCSCHLIHLCSEKSCLKLPRSLEDLIRDVAAHFSRSHQRQLKFAELQDLFETERHQILKRAETRWLSREACVNRIIEQYQPLKSYFNDFATGDHSKTTLQTTDTLNNPFTLLYLKFMSYVLHLLNEFNKKFQSREPMLHKLKPEIKDLLKSVCLNFIQPSYVQGASDIFALNHFDKKIQLMKNAVFLGPDIGKTLDEVKKIAQAEELDKFYTTCFEFYVELATQIKQRFVFRDPVFKHIEILNPAEAISFNTKSLAPIVHHFPALQNSDIDVSELDIEYRNFVLLDFKKLGINTESSAVMFWKRIFNLKNGAGNPIFVNLARVIKFLLILPFSNVEVERLFSQLKDMKTDKRNRLATETVRSLFHCKAGIENAVDFQPSEKVIKKFLNRQERHPPKPKDTPKPKDK